MPCRNQLRLNSQRLYLHHVRNVRLWPVHRHRLQHHRQRHLRHLPARKLLSRPHHLQRRGVRPWSVLCGWFYSTCPVSSWALLPERLRQDRVPRQQLLPQRVVGSHQLLGLQPRLLQERQLQCDRQHGVSRVLGRIDVHQHVQRGPVLQLQHLPWTARRDRMYCQF